MSKQFTTDNFEKEVIEESKNKPVLIDFFAEWCGPCKMQGPIVDELAIEIGEKASIGKLDTEAEQAIAMKYNVMSIPTLIIFKNGEPKEIMVGMRSKEALKEALEIYM